VETQRSCAFPPITLHLTGNRHFIYECPTRILDVRSFTLQCAISSCTAEELRRMTTSASFTLAASYLLLHAILNPEQDGFLISFACEVARAGAGSVQAS